MDYNNQNMGIITEIIHFICVRLIIEQNLDNFYS